MDTQCLLVRQCAKGAQLIGNDSTWLRKSVEGTLEEFKNVITPTFQNNLHIFGGSFKLFEEIVPSDIHGNALTSSSVKLIGS